MLRSCNVDGWNDSHCCLTPIKQWRQAGGLLLDSIEPYRFCGAAIAHCHKCCRIYQKDYCCRSVLNLLLRWKHYRYRSLSTSASTPQAEQIAGPQTFRPKDAPRYVPAEITIICCWGACLADLLFVYWYCASQNKKKASFQAHSPTTSSWKIKSGLI